LLSFQGEGFIPNSTLIFYQGEGFTPNSTLIFYQGEGFCFISFSFLHPVQSIYPVFLPLPSGERVRVRGLLSSPHPENTHPGCHPEIDVFYRPVKELLDIT